MHSTAPLGTTRCVRRPLAGAIAGLVLCALGACGTSPPAESNGKAEVPRVGEDRASTAGESGLGNGASSASASRAPIVMTGTGVFVGTPPPAAKQSSVPAPGEGFELNFVDTDISTVVASVIGEALGLPYLVDPQVKGTISLQAARPLSRTEILPALEAALRVQGAALIAANGGYNVVPLKDAPRQITALQTAGERRPGYGIKIVPLQYVSAAEMEKLLRPFALDGAILRVDESRNLLLLAGPSQELATLTGVVQTFDVDWLAGMSFAVFPLEYASARTIAEELTQVFADPKSPIANLVKLVPLARLNSLVVMTPQPEYLKKVEAWVKQLDTGAGTPGRRVYVFEVQNGKAVDMANSLNDILSLSATPYVSASNAQERERARSGVGGGDGPQADGVGGLPDGGRSRYQTPPNYGTGAGIGGGNGGMKIVPNEESNSLLIFATAEEFATVEGAMKRLDVEPIQVLLEASLAEVTLNDNLRFGLQWAYQSDQGPVTLSEVGSGAVARQFPGFSYLYTGRQNIQAVLNTLETLTDVNVVSSPKLLVLNNHEAQLQVGDQVPIATQTAVSTIGDNSPIINSVELRDTGIILRVTPRANKNGLVLLDIAQEVSDVVPTTTSDIDSPTIQQRKVSSSVAVHDGETIALGGLIRDQRSKSRAGIPLLQRVPLLGPLFGSTDNSRRRTELIVLITPRVIRSRREASEMMDELREQFRTLRKTLP